MKRHHTEIQLLALIQDPAPLTPAVDGSIINVSIVALRLRTPEETAVKTLWKNFIIDTIPQDSIT